MLYSLNIGTVIIGK